MERHRIGPLFQRKLVNATEWFSQPLELLPPGPRTSFPPRKNPYPVRCKTSPRRFWGIEHARRVLGYEPRDAAPTRIDDESEVT